MPPFRTACYGLVSAGSNLSFLAYGYLKDFWSATKDGDGYYPFWEEVLSLSAAIPQLSPALEDTDVVVDLGGGDAHAILAKTIPVLARCRKLKRYVALDIDPVAAAAACALVRQHFPDLEVEPKVIDFSKSFRMLARLYLMVKHFNQR